MKALFAKRLSFRTLLYQLLRWYWRLFRPVVLGTRLLVVSGNQILLVRMTYTNGWYLPGGGVERGESFRSAAARELREECGLEARDLSLFGMYTTNQQGKTDHVAVFLVHEFREVITNPDPEIAEARFFAFDELPERTTPATKRRIQEYLRGAGADGPRCETW